MKLKIFLILFSFLALVLTSGCSDQNSPSDVQNKANMITRSWAGDKFFTVSSGSTLRVAKDLVLLMEFKSDGSFQLVYAIDSGPGRGGNWKLEGDGNVIRLTSDTLHSGIFTIVELSSSRFVFGDTSSNGYSLFPLFN
jgi:hypothetical protein